MRAAFEAHARDTWSMPSKVYVSNYPAGDFRAMPAIGDGHALLKWVTSFPGNPASRAADGDRARPAVGRGRRPPARGTRCGRGHRASDCCGRRAGRGHALSSRGVLVRGGRLLGSTAPRPLRMLVAHGVAPLVWDVDESRRRLVAERLGARVASSAAEALACEVVITVTPGAEVLYPDGLARARSARFAHGRGRAGEGRGRRSRSFAAPISSATTGSRRATEGSSRPPCRWAL